VRAWGTIAVSAVLAGIGVVLIVETALVGGVIGYLLGVLFLLAGSFRALLTRWSRSR
jgi:hypothetical protein